MVDPQKTIREVSGEVTDALGKGVDQMAEAGKKAGNTFMGMPTKGWVILGVIGLAFLFFWYNGGF